MSGPPATWQHPCMRGRRGLCGVVALLICLSGLGVTGSSPAAAVDPDYDTFDAVTLTPDGSGNELPYAGPAHQWNVDVGNTSTYTVQASESGTTNNVNGCQQTGGGFVYAGRTAWLRFDPAVNGQIY